MLANGGMHNVESCLLSLQLSSTIMYIVMFCVCGFVLAGEESGASLFERELSAEMTTERDEQVLS